MLNLRTLLRATLGMGGLLVTLSYPLQAQFGAGSGEIQRIYQRLCMDCHGSDLRGGLASSMLNGQWQFGGSDSSIARSIRDGQPELGMPGFGDVLSEEEIRAMVIYIREAERRAQLDETVEQRRPSEGVFNSEEARFRLERVAEADGILWAISFLPDGSGLVTQRDGKLWKLKDDALLGPIRGIPSVWRGGQGGLLDVAIHPDFEENKWVYLAFSDRPARSGGGMTKVVRGRIDQELRWQDEETIWESPREMLVNTQHHFGSRIVFQDGYVFFTIGDRGQQEKAQDLSVPHAKVFRLYDDGRIPSDNPFVDKEDALAETWSYGLRNIQGMAIHPETGEIWTTKHGPRGGDELNLIRPGVNYGWPVITHGMNYDGTPITAITEAPGLEQPVHYWTPSIAPCGIGFYTGDVFSGWKNHLFVAGLASEQLTRLVIEDGKVAHEEIVFSGQGRIRDVTTGPEGLLYLAIEGGRGGLIYRMVPVKD